MQFSKNGVFVVLLNNVAFVADDVTWVHNTYITILQGQLKSLGHFFGKNAAC